MVVKWFASSWYYCSFLTAVINNLWKINFQYSVSGIRVALLFHSDKTVKAVCSMVRSLHSWLTFTNSKSSAKLHKNVQMNHDCILWTPKNICAHIKFSRISLILIWGLSLVSSIAFVCVNTLWCAVQVDVQREAVGNETSVRAVHVVGLYFDITLVWMHVGS